MVWTTTSAALVGLLHWLRPELGDAADLATGAGAPASLEGLLVTVAAIALAGSAVWLWFVASVAALEAATGRVRQHVRGCPRPWRRLMLAACGVAVVSSVVAPAGAVPRAYEERDSRAQVVALLRHLPLPDRPVGASSREEPRPAPLPDRPSRSEVVVRSGDTLWSLAAHSLASGASAAQITSRWQQIYAANRALIGPDPGLILPAQRLRVPTVVEGR